MNPKNLSHLDPKLKEAYERVMGTSVPSPAQASPAPIAAPSPTPAVSAPVQETPQNQVVANKKKEGLSPILVGVAVILFFVAYTVVWIQVFKLKIPFLP